MRTRLIALLGLPFLLLLAGCASGPKYSPLALQVVELKPADTGYTLTWRYLNPNTQPLAIVSSHHTLELDGVSLGRVESKDPVGVPALGASAQTLRLSPELSKAIGNFSARHPGASVTYGVEGNVELSLLGDDLSTLRADGRGRVTLGTAQ